MTASQPSPTPRLAYVPALDGLRAVAVCAVITFHATEMSANHWLPGGWAGVDMFFVLSGFLITSNLRRERDATGRTRLGAFYTRRLLRLTPALWAMIAVSALAGLLVYSPAEMLTSALIAVTYSMNWVRAFDLNDGPVLGHTWSLAMEEQFYLLWPILFIALKPRARIPALAAAVLIVTAWRVALHALGASATRTYTGPDTHADGLLIGCIAALLPASRWHRAAARLGLVPFGALLVILKVMTHTTPFAQTFGFTIIALLTAWLIIALRGGSLPSAWLSHPVPVFIGRISYGLYLWHFPLFMLLKPEIPHLAVPTLIGASFACAWASYVVVERPFLRLKSSFEPALDKTGRMPDTAAAKPAAGVRFNDVIDEPQDLARRTGLDGFPDARLGARLQDGDRPGQPEPMRRPGLQSGGC